MTRDQNAASAIQVRNARTPATRGTTRIPLGIKKRQLRDEAGVSDVRQRPIDCFSAHRDSQGHPALKSPMYSLMSKKFRLPNGAAMSAAGSFALNSPM